MIYNCYVNSLLHGYILKAPEYDRDHYGQLTSTRPPKKLGSSYSLFKCLALTLENSEDTFVFTLAKHQEEKWKEEFEPAGLQKFVALETPYVKNPNYPEHPPKIKFIVLKGAKAK